MTLDNKENVEGKNFVVCPRSQIDGKKLPGAERNFNMIPNKCHKFTSRV